MRALPISIFLFIFLAACSDSTEQTNPSKNEVQQRGSSVILTDHCQQLSVIEPDQVKKHELPLPLQPLVDYCSSLLLAPQEPFNSSKIFYQCQLSWYTNDESANDKLKNDIDNLVGQPIGDDLEAQGDINSGESSNGDIRSHDVFISIDSGFNVQALWTLDNLWPEFNTDIINLGDLEWRFNLQTTNPQLCSETAFWGQTEETLFVDNVEKCGDTGKAVSSSYIFSLSGRLITSESQEVVSSSLCQ